MARPHVPQFGKWDNEENVPYTVYFEKARQGRKGERVNPNDPQSQALSPGPTESIREPASRSRHDQRASRDLPSRDEVGRRGAAEEPTQQRYGVDKLREAQKRIRRASLGSEGSFEHSPHHQQAKPPARGTRVPPSPAREGRGSSHGTPARSPMSPMRPGTRVNNIPEKDATVPRFGVWNEKDPADAEGYTEIFNKMREDKRNGADNRPIARGQMGATPLPSTNKEPKETDGCWPLLKGCFAPGGKK